MTRTNQAGLPGLVELGSVSADTQGDGGLYWEIGGLQPHPGICAE